MSQPHDQDWDFMSVLNKDGMVMDVNVVKVKEGREEDFQVLREKVTRSSRNVVSVTKFDVERDIMVEGNAIYFDSTNNKMWISVFESMDAWQIAISELTKNLASQALMTLLFDSFECILCSVATANLPPAYYPPYLVFPTQKNPARRENLAFAQYAFTTASKVKLSE